VLLHDGSMYFVALCLFNVAVLVITLKPIGNNALGFTTCAEPIIFIIMSRFLLSLRQAATFGSHVDTVGAGPAGTSRFSSIQFAAGVVSDMGAVVSDSFGFGAGGEGWREEDAKEDSGHAEEAASTSAENDAMEVAHA